MKPLKIHVLNIIAVVAALTGFVAASGGLIFAEEQPFSRAEVEHGFGTEAGKVFYPERAIDTDKVTSVAFAAETAPDEPLKYYKIAPDTYFFYANIAEVDENNRGFNGNAGFVVTDSGVVVLDALGSPRLGKRMISTIKSVTDKPIDYLIITHNHPDHAYGAIAFRALPGVTVIGHEGVLKYLNSDRMAHSVNYRNTFIREDMQGFAPVTPDRLVGGERFSRQTLQTGGKTFEIYNTGAHHSYGDLVVYQKEEGIVWISDLAFNNRVTFMADGSSAKAIAAQTWLLETFSDAKLMVPGHGSAQTPPFTMVRRTRDYMQRLRQDVAEALEAEQGLQATIDNTHYKDWEATRLYRLNHKKNVDFVYRELEMDLF